jgi:uncharacterized membrane protein
MNPSTIFVATSAALASGVEFVEALTIVLAVGVSKSWRDALEGTAGAVVALAAMVAIVGIGLLQLVPLDVLRTVIGALLLIFGLKWLRKAILRYAGLKALHDEEKAFQEEVARVRANTAGRGRDWFAVSTAFNGVFLEGLEVIFIVIGMGAAGKAMGAATAGALVAGFVVVLAGLALHRPLKAVPENTMKFVVGIMLTSFGTLWLGEGLGVRWWHADFFIPILIVGYLIVSGLLISWLKAGPTARTEIRTA